MSASVSHSIKHRATAKDVFFTPEAVVKTQIQHVVDRGVREEDIWLDPFKGGGVYYDNFPTEYKDYMEIAEGFDFFSYTSEVDIICSNPPYSMIDKVLEKSVSLKPRVISYLLLHGAMTPKRMEYMETAGYGLVSIYTCKVYKWYGMAEAYTFEKGADNDHCSIKYDRVVHRLTDAQEMAQAEASKKA